jgi:hypothetical protein
MNALLTIAFIVAAIFGWIKGGEDMKRARHDPSIGVKPSQNLISFLFLD